MIRGTKRKIEKNENVTRINPTVNASIHNRFDIEVVDAKTGKVKQKAYAENVILDNWWLAIGGPTTSSSTSSYYGAASGMVFGSGSGNPSQTDTDLFSRFGSIRLIDNSSCQYGAPTTDTYTMTLSTSLDETKYVGNVFTEIGLCSFRSVSYASTSYFLDRVVTHAMLKDMNGNQVSLTKTETDIFNITATVFLHWDADGYGDGNIKCLLGGLAPNGSYSAIGFPCFVARLLGRVSFSADLFSLIGRSPATNETVNDCSWDVDSSSKAITITASRFPVGSWNNPCTVATIDSWTSNNRHKQPIFALIVGGEDFPGTQITGETIGTADGSSIDFNTKFPYAKNAKIYIDGVEQTNGVSFTDGLNASEAAQSGRYLMSVFEDSELTNIKPYWVACYHFALKCRFGSQSYCNEVPPNKTFVIYNPNYKEVPVTSVENENAVISGVYTKDGIGGEWIKISKTIPSEYQNYPFFKIVCSSYDSTEDRIDIVVTPPAINNIHFDEPPAAGSIITADYFTETIAKDENHVFDFSLTIQLGEYTGE